MQSSKKRRCVTSPSASRAAAKIMLTSEEESDFSSGNMTRCDEGHSAARMGSLSRNVFLTIWDDDEVDDDERVRAILEQNDLTIKEEIQDQTASPSMQIPVHYRLVQQEEQIPKHMQQMPEIVAVSSTATQTHDQATQIATSTTILDPITATGVHQLPSGCEIFLVKEFTTQPTKATLNATDNYKNNAFVFQPAAKTTGTPTQKSPITSTSHGKSSQPNKMKSDPSRKITFRDDKRRATHNEVERRRRDKINSWIFRLKEMLPVSEKTTSKERKCFNGGFGESSQKSSQSHINSSSGGRPPPNDSKSQILIKACDYIKTLQEEIKSLRECLKDSELLRLSNEKLRNEINLLKSNSGNKVAAARMVIAAQNFDKDDDGSSVIADLLNATAANCDFPVSLNNVRNTKAGGEGLNEGNNVMDEENVHASYSLDHLDVEAVNVASDLEKYC